MIIVSITGGILMSTGSFPESFSQRILVGIILAGRVGVPVPDADRPVSLLVLSWMHLRLYKDGPLYFTPAPAILDALVGII